MKFNIFVVRHVGVVGYSVVFENLEVLTRCTRRFVTEFVRSFHYIYPVHTLQSRVFNTRHNYARRDVFLFPYVHPCFWATDRRVEYNMHILYSMHRHDVTYPPSYESRGRRIHIQYILVCNTFISSIRRNSYSCPTCNDNVSKRTIYYNNARLNNICICMRVCVCACVR